MSAKDQSGRGARIGELFGMYESTLPSPMHNSLVHYQPYIKNLEPPLYHYERSKAQHSANSLLLHPKK